MGSLQSLPEHPRRRFHIFIPVYMVRLNAVLSTASGLRGHKLQSRWRKARSTARSSTSCTMARASAFRYHCEAKAHFGPTYGMPRTK
eukprot:2722090-Pyramimonas_sp.AAC.1